MREWYNAVLPRLQKGTAMNKVTLNADLPNQLNGLQDPLELCDTAGQTVGYFVPAAEYEKLADFWRKMHDWANSLVTDEELDRAEQEPEEYTTEEVLRQLEQL
jgi:hypothetical protein